MLESSTAVAYRLPTSVGKPPRLQDVVFEELCDLWGRLFFSAAADRPKRVMITAAGRGEGVTQIACGLALAAGLHQTDHSVVLVDFNVRHPRVARVLGLANVPGLAEVLTMVSPLEGAVKWFEGTVLSVLPAGGPQTRPLSLLAGRPVKDLFEELNERFDHVLIDAPAVNCHPEAQILAPIMDGVLLVVRVGRSSRQAVLQANKRLELARGRLLGAVLNDRVYPLPEFLYRRL